MIRWLIHRVVHFFGWQHGQIVTEWYEGEIWVGFQCGVCGEVTGAHPAPRHTYQ